MELATDIISIFGWALFGGIFGIKIYGEEWHSYDQIPAVTALSFALISASFVLGN